MPRQLTLSMPDELSDFVDQNCGAGFPHSTPGEFILFAVSEQQARQAAAVVREQILKGYQDAIEGRVVEYRGDLHALLKREPSEI